MLSQCHQVQHSFPLMKDHLPLFMLFFLYLDQSEELLDQNHFSFQQEVLQLFLSASLFDWEIYLHYQVHLLVPQEIS